MAGVSEEARVYEVFVCFQVDHVVLEAFRAPRHDRHSVFGVTTPGSIVCCGQSFGPEFVAKVAEVCCPNFAA